MKLLEHGHRMIHASFATVGILSGLGVGRFTSLLALKGAGMTLQDYELATTQITLMRCGATTRGCE